MGLFGKLFGSKQPAPPCEIHSDDRDLIRKQDTEWWESLSLNDRVALMKEDEVFRFATWRKFVESDGLSDADAGRKVRLTFPSYYMKLTHRADEKFSLLASDAKLPLVLKDRVNRAVMGRIITKQAVEGTSSMNALVRQLIRAGRI